MSLEADYSTETVAMLVALIQRGAILVPLTTAVREQRDEFLATAEVELRLIERPDGGP